MPKKDWLLPGGGCKKRIFCPYMERHWSGDYYAKGGNYGLDAKKTRIKGVWFIEMEKAWITSDGKNNTCAIEDPIAAIKQVLYLIPK